VGGAAPVGEPRWPGNTDHARASTAQNQGETMKIKLICTLTTIALFALPAANAFAGHYI
jgi:hypothetical protein